jgi:PAS domain S-box-containing protein
MPADSRSQGKLLLRYAVAVAATAAAGVVDHFLQPLIYPSVTPPFILAVALAALYGGIGPGLLASVLGALVLNYWFFPPLHALEIGSSADLARQLVYLVVATVIAWLGGTVHSQRWRAVQTNAALRASQERFGLATEALAGFLYDWDPVTNRLEVFGGTEEVMGFQLADITAEVAWFESRVHPDDLAQGWAVVRAALESGATGYLNVYRFRHRDGHYVEVADRSRIVRDEAGRPIRVLGGVSDISERRRLEREREALLDRERQARTAAEAAAHERDAVLAIVSHDLGTPLSTIAMCARALVDQDEPFEDRRKVVDLIDRAVSYMYHMIRDLSDVASIEAGHLALDLHAEDPAAIVAAAAEMLAGTALDRGVALETKSGADLPTIRADATRVLQGLGNLVTNAVQFTERGGCITLRAEREGSGVRFTVEDTGAGISADDLPYVFDRFWHKRRGVGGNGRGLGLAITRGIVEAHGGQLRAESTLGRGSEFSFTLPVAN